MSGPKTSRRAFLAKFTGAAKRARGAVKREVTTYRPLKGPNAISRRQAVGRIITGALATTGAYFGARKIAEKIPFWTRAQKRYLLTMHFAEHQQDAPLSKPMIEEIEKAKQRGEPFHVFFTEAALNTGRKHAESIRVNEENAKQIRKAYANLRSRNFGHENAVQIVVDNLSKNTDIHPHKVELIVVLALEKIKIIPIEVYPEKIAEELKKAYSIATVQDLNFQKMVSLGAPVLSLQESVMNFLKGSSVTNKIRDRNFNEIEQRFLDAVSLFPELGKLEQVRAIGFLGSAHRNFYINFNQSESQVEISETRPLNRSLSEYSSLNAHPKGIPSQRQARLTVLGYYLDPLIENLRKKGNNTLSDRLFRNTIRITQREFEQLNELTKEIRDIVDRTAFIADWILSKS